MKRCRTCAQEKPLEEFYLLKKGTEWRASYCKPCQRIMQEKYRKNHPERQRAAYLRWSAKKRAENEEDFRRKSAEYAAEWRSQNPERALATKRRFRARHPGSNNVHDGRRRAAMYGTRTGPIDLTAIRERDGDRCHICGHIVPPQEIGFDHMVPVSRGGTHTEDNLFVAHRRCNLRKNAKRQAHPCAFVAEFV